MEEETMNQEVEWERRVNQVIAYSTLTMIGLVLLQMILAIVEFTKGIGGAPAVVIFCINVLFFCALLLYIYVKIQYSLRWKVDKQ